MSFKLLTEHNLEFLSFKGGCVGSSESIDVKMPHWWKPHGAAQLSFVSECKERINKNTKVLELDY